YTTLFRSVDRGDYPLAGIRALGVGVQPVGEDRAGGIVLGAVDPESALAIRTDLGDYLPHLPGAYLGPGVAHQLAGSEAGQPLVASRTRRGNQAVLDKGEVRTQRLGNIRIRGRQIDEQLEELRQRSTSATVRFRYAHGSEPGSGQI